jgi:hypothetical protein
MARNLALKIAFAVTFAVGVIFFGGKKILKAIEGPNKRG